ncbi:MAG TPA: TonB-dependent receptor plug domain-containing protein, partial [Cyclobacteriaceae bacterium]|nr:TonB-dependent receptor plug domain-containing protein [Cyclobacteriaceae bacterium]
MRSNGSFFLRFFLLLLSFLPFLSGQAQISGTKSARRDTVRTLQAVIVNGIRTINGMGRLDEVHNGAIYSGKKTEVLLVDSLDANTAQNNPRQVLGRIPGANYSETQGSGFPSNGIGFRGLNPTQSVETNTRQNGYNLAADIYGYSESYYQPPLEAVQRIEITRGE